MLSLLNRPDVQSALLPFTAALLAAAILRPAAPRIAGAALVIGFLAAALSVNGVVVVPLTGTRKIILLSIGALLIGAAADRGRWSTPARLSGLLVLAAAAFVWVGWNVIVRSRGPDLLRTLAIGLLLLGWLVVVFDRQRDSAICTGSAALALGLGAGVAAIMAGTALIGQLALALGAAAGGYLLLAVLVRGTHAGATFAYSAALTGGLLVLGAHLFAKLPALALLPLAAVPLATRLRLPARVPRFFQAAIRTAAGIGVAALAPAVVWLITDGPAS